jgi:hypothetical protein
LILSALLILRAVQVGGDPEEHRPHRSSHVKAFSAQTGAAERTVGSSVRARERLVASKDARAADPSEKVREFDARGRRIGF